MLSLKRDTLIILQIFILIIIGFLIKERMTKVKENFSWLSSSAMKKYMASKTKSTPKPTTKPTPKPIKKKYNWSTIFANIRKAAEEAKKKNEAEKKQEIEQRKKREEAAAKKTFTQNILFLEFSEEINKIIEKHKKNEFVLTDLTKNDKIYENQYIIINMEGSYKKDDLEKFKNYRDKRVKYIILGSNRNAILYEGENFDKFRESYVIEKSTNLNDIIFSDKLSSIKITSTSSSDLLKEAALNNQIFLFDKPRFVGKIMKINIPSKEHQNLLALDDSINIKSIIIPKNRNIKIIFDNNPDTVMTESNYGYKKIGENKNKNLITLRTLYNGNKVEQGIGAIYYQIKAINPNIELNMPIKILQENKIELNKIKSKLNKVIMEKEIKNKNINENEELIMNKMIHRLVNDIKKKRNNVLFKINQMPN